MRAVYSGYVLLGLGGPLLVAGMLLFGMVFVPRRGPPMALLTLHHPAFIAAAIMGVVGLCLTAAGSFLTVGRTRHSRPGKPPPW